MQAESGKGGADRFRVQHIGEAGECGDPGQHGTYHDGGETAGDAPGQTHMRHPADQDDTEREET